MDAHSWEGSWARMRPSIPQRSTTMPTQTGSQRSWSRRRRTSVSRSTDRRSSIAGRASIPAHPTNIPSSTGRTPTCVVVGGFAGHGLMHAPAAGLLAAELILDGQISSLDPDEVSLTRFSRPLESVEQTGI